MARAEVPEFIIKRLVGHAGSVTEDVYMDPWSLIERMRSAVAVIPPVRVPDAAQVRSGFAVVAYGAA